MKIIISGGGTGGHVFPAVAIARAIKRLRPETEILFVGAKGKMEMEKVPAEGFPIRGLWISGFKRSLSISNVLFPLRLMVSLGQAMAILLKFKPHAVVGVGGFASGPVMRAAAWLGIPIYMQEQNSFPGVTNRMMASKARLIFIAFPGMSQWFPAEKTLMVGNPVRRNVIHIDGKIDEARQYFGMNKNTPIVLVIGGSQGAFSINRAVRACLKQNATRSLQWIWQTGAGFASEAQEFVQSHVLTQVKVYPFIERMDLAYAAADIIVSRAGAIAISELCHIGKPVILIPYPFAAANHQMHNARRIAEAGGAFVLEDSSAESQLCSSIGRLLADPNKRRQMGEALRRLAIPDADEHIAQALLNDLDNLKKG